MKEKQEKERKKEKWTSEIKRIYSCLKKKKKKMEGEELNTNQENVLLLEKNEKKKNK